LTRGNIAHFNSFRQEAAGALWNLSFDDKNREAIAAAGGVEALVTSFICSPKPPQALHYLFNITC
jgi:hypothetical protein